MACLILLLIGVGLIIMRALKRKERNRIDQAETIAQFHPTALKDFQQKISNDFEVLEKLDGNMQKEKTEPIMKWAGK